MTNHKYVCPHCSQHLEIHDDLLGQTLECPSCKGQFTIPKPTSIPVAARQGVSQAAESRFESEPGSFSSRLLEFQGASNYMLVRKTLRSSGIGSIVFGLIAMYMGFGGMMSNPLNAILGMIGLFLVGEGIWIIVSPTPAGLIVDGISLCALGVWNILITVMTRMAGDESNLFAILGLWQIVWGTQSFVRYKRFSTMPATRPSAEVMNKIDGIVTSIAQANTKEAQDIVEIQTKSLAGKEIWKGQLLDGAAIFVEGSGPNAVFVGKKDVEIVAKGKVLTGKTLKVKCRIGNVNFDGTIAPLHWDRVKAWMEG